MGEQQLTYIRGGVALRRGHDPGVDLRCPAADARRPDAGARVRPTSFAEQRVNAECAIPARVSEFSAVFDEIADPYLRERKGDLADLAAA